MEPCSPGLKMTAKRYTSGFSGDNTFGLTLLFAHGVGSRMLLLHLPIFSVPVLFDGIRVSSDGTGDSLIVLFEQIKSNGNLR